MPRRKVPADDPEADLRPVLRSRDVCKMLGIGRRTLDTYIFKGWLPPDRKIGPQGMNAWFPETVIRFRDDPPNFKRRRSPGRKVS